MTSEASDQDPFGGPDYPQGAGQSGPPRTMNQMGSFIGWACVLIGAVTGSGVQSPFPVRQVRARRSTRVNASTAPSSVDTAG